MGEEAIAYRTRARARRKSLSPARRSRPASATGDQRPVVDAACKTSRKRTSRRRAVVQSDSGDDTACAREGGADEGAGIEQEEVASPELESLAARRRRLIRGAHAARRDPSPAPASSDSDVVIVEERQSGNAADGLDVVISEPQPARQQHGDARRGDAAKAGAAAKDPIVQEDDDLDSDEELRIVGMVGQVVTRDLPHPRPDCAVHRFTLGVTHTNGAHCGQCFCYVCDVKASECRFWGTGRRERDHANARQHPAWNALRAAARAGNAALVRREFRTHGPLRKPSPPRQQAPPPPPPPPPPRRRLPSPPRQWQDPLGVLGLVLDLHLAQNVFLDGGPGASGGAARAAPAPPVGHSAATETTHRAAGRGAAPAPAAMQAVLPSTAVHAGLAPAAAAILHPQPPSHPQFVQQPPPAYPFHHQQHYQQQQMPYLAQLHQLQQQPQFHYHHAQPHYPHPYGYQNVPIQQAYGYRSGAAPFPPPGLPPGAPQQQQQQQHPHAHYWPAYPAQQHPHR